MNTPITFAQRLSAAAHQGLKHANPLPAEALEDLVARVARPGVQRVLDVGCGAGATAVALAQAAPIAVLGLDLNPDFIAQARARSEGLPLQGAVEWRLGDLTAVADEPPFDALWCMGSSQAFGGPLDLLREAHARVRPGGSLIVGELEWVGEPAAAFLSDLGLSAADLWLDAAVPDVFVRHGWQMDHRVVASASAMAAYEAAVEAGRLAFADRVSQSEPDGAARVRAQVAGWRELMARHGSGWQFAAHILRRPTA